MKKHVKAMTYKPKIPYIRSGECRQTIRAGDSVHEGDEILFHGWSGLPYRSKWDWRLRITVTKTIPILIDWYNGIGHDDALLHAYNWCGWNSEYANKLAVKDYIEPATGVALRDVLTGLNGKLHFEHYQIIRW